MRYSDLKYTRCNYQVFDTLPLFDCICTQQQQQVYSVLPFCTGVTD